MQHKEDPFSSPSENPNDRKKEMVKSARQYLIYYAFKELFEVGKLPSELLVKKPDYSKDFLRDHFWKIKEELELLAKIKLGQPLEDFFNNFHAYAGNRNEFAFTFLVNVWYCHISSELKAQCGVDSRQVAFFERISHQALQDFSLVSEVTLHRRIDMALQYLPAISYALNDELSAFDLPNRGQSTQEVEKPLEPLKQTLDLNEQFRKKMKKSLRGDNIESVEAVTSRQVISFINLFADQFSELYFWSEGADNNEDIERFEESMYFLMDTFTEKKIKKRVLNQILEPIELRLGVSLVDLQNKNMRPFKNSLVKYLFFVGLILAYEQKIIAFKKLGFDRASSSLSTLDEAVQDFRGSFYDTQLVIDNLVDMFNRYRKDSDLQKILSKL